MDFPYGEIVSKLPENFAPPEMWPEYGVIANPPDIWAREWVGENPRGYRWALWPFCFEQYVDDEEPDLKKSEAGKLARNRLIIWKRVSRKDIPAGWFVPYKDPWQIDGFCFLNSDSDYSSAWSRILRRHLHTWQQDFSSRYSIEIIPLADFEAAYMKNPVIGKIGTKSLEITKRKCNLRDDSVRPRLWGVRNRETREVIAAMAIYYSPKRKSSVYECPFVLEEGKRVHAMVGLIDHWFRLSVQNGTNLQIFTFFWHPGLEDTWKGFSEFKSHFNLKYVAYPPVLWRFQRGKLN